MENFDDIFFGNNNTYNNNHINIEERIILDLNEEDDNKTEKLYCESDSEPEEPQYESDVSVGEINEYKNGVEEKTKMPYVKSEEYYEKIIFNFMKYYNEKYNKDETIFTGIADNKQTNFQMEIFYTAINNFNEMVNILNIETEDLINYIYKKTEYIDNEVYKELYCLDMGDLKLYTPLLINALNYIVINEINEWLIFCLKEYEIKHKIFVINKNYIMQNIQTVLNNAKTINYNDNLNEIQSKFENYGEQITNSNKTKYDADHPYEHEEDFINCVKKYIEVDNKTREYKDDIAKLNKKKTEFVKKILLHMEKMGETTITINGGKLTVNEYYSKGTMKKDLVEETLKEKIKDGNITKEIIETIEKKKENACVRRKQLKRTFERKK